MEKVNSVKKGQQENKKKKNNENRSKVQYKQVNNNSRPKKTKKNKTSEGEKPLRKTTKQGSSFLWLIFISMLDFAGFIAFLYLVDYDRFLKVKQSANASLNKTLSYLPPELVIKGKNGFEFIYSAAEVVISKLAIVLSKLSMFLSTNPVIREHWVIAKEISSVCGGLFVDYLRMLYLHTCEWCSKLLPKVFQ